jgi:hypothetical protein
MSLLLTRLLLIGIHGAHLSRCRTKASLLEQASDA